MITIHRNDDYAFDDLIVKYFYFVKGVNENEKKIDELINLFYALK